MSEPQKPEVAVAVEPAPVEVKTATRSMVLPIGGPVENTWPELRAALRSSWGETTRCANWMLTELYMQDVKRTPDLKKLPAMPKTYLYPVAREKFPTLASQSVSSLEREVTRKYRARRYDLIWLQKASLPVMRYPVGLPIPSQMWRLFKTDEGVWIFSCRIGDHRFKLRLRGGPHFRRQLNVLEKVLTGDYKAGGATLYQITSHEGDNRPEAQPQRRLVVRIPVELPIKERKVEGVLPVKTAADALIIAGEENDWVEHHDHIRRAIWAQMRQQQHLSEDLKAERRRPKRQREGIVDRMGRLSHRHALQMRTWIHEAAAHLVGYAVRRKYDSIVFDDTVRTFAPRFPWGELRQRISEKCELAGIKLTITGKEPPKEEAEEKTTEG